MAKDAKFVKRERTISGSVFAQELIFSKFDCKSMSLENLAEAITARSLKEISKQAVDLRFTDEAVGFFKLLIEAALQGFYSGEARYGFLKDFTEVRVKDSTCFQVPFDMAAKYPGSGGASSTACIRIQFEYDEKQKEKIDLILEKYARKNSELQNSFRKELDGNMKEFRKEVDSNLSKDQLTRLREMDDRRQGMIRQNMKNREGDSLNFRNERRRFSDSTMPPPGSLRYHKFDSAGSPHIK